MSFVQIIFLSLCLISAPAIGLSAEQQNDSDISDQSLDALLQTDTELKAEVGSRSGERNLLDANAAVDVVTAKQIESTGLSSLTDVLRYYIAGFNAPETSVADGSDHVRAFSLRGMAPDQVLVLVNGKRLHSSALLHVNGTIGRGSSGVDLDTIAVSSIDRIEVLRDGAAAQYGSDAISGVINIVLKGSGYQNRLATSGGLRSRGDGTRLQGNAFLTLPLQYDGFINMTLEGDKQQQTQRAGVDKRLAVPRVDTHVGLPDATNYRSVIHAEIPLSNDMMPYFTGLVNKRTSRASAFFRPPSANSAPIFPNGFLPQINARILDYSLTGGIKGQLSDSLSWELSHVYGYNGFQFLVDNSMNFSLAAASPISFDNGTLSFAQQTTNLDIKNHTESLDVAAGLEMRLESYKIKAGEFASFTGTASQGFAGFRPENTVAGKRTNFAFYADSTYRFNPELSLEGAFRVEKSNDFNTTSTVKVAASYKIMPSLMLRSSASTGFRAPSLSQVSYSQTSSFVDTATNLLTSQGTFRPGDPLSIALGAKPLKAEKSQHLTLGAVFQPSPALSLTVDYFYTRVNDRIMLSNDLAGSTPAQAAILAANNVTKARFFTNAVDTTTQGVDVRINSEYDLAYESKLTLSLWYNYNRNRVLNFNNPVLTRARSFDQVDRMEHGQPKSAWRLLSHYQLGDWDMSLNFSRFGAYRQIIANQPYDFDAAWTTDMEIKYNVMEGIEIALGGNNIFDTVPNKWKGLSGTFFGFDGIKPHSRYSPFGYSGAYYYARASVEF